MRLCLGHVFAVSILAAVPPCATAQTSHASGYQAPRTPDGRPDLNGVWGTDFLTQLERPDEADRLVATPELAHKLEALLRSDGVSLDDPDMTHFGSQKLAIVRGETRTSQIVEPSNGKLPFSQAALAISDIQRPDGYGNDNPEEMSNSLRCITGLVQAPIRTLPLFIPLQLVQTSQAVVLMMEDVAGPRIIHLSGDPPPDTIRSWEGYSAGRWESDTLVVETSHLRFDDPFREHYGRSIVVGPDSRIVERFTRISEAELLYQFTVEDPRLYAMPWQGEYAFTRSDEKLYEYACHEANYSLVNALLVGRVRDGVR